MITESELRTFKAKTSAPKTTSKEKDSIEGDKFLLRIYRETEINWNSAVFSYAKNLYSFLVSRIKLNYDDIATLSTVELDTKIKDRDPKLPELCMLMTDIPLSDYTQFPPNTNLETETKNTLNKLSQVEKEKLKSLADQGHSRLQLLQAFLSLNNNKNSALSYLQRSAEKYPLAKFIYLRNLLRGSSTWGIAADKTKAIEGFDELREESDVYAVLTSLTLYNGLTATLIEQNELSEELQAIVQPIINHHNILPSTFAASPMGPPVVFAFPTQSIIKSNMQKNNSRGVYAS